MSHREHVEACVFEQMVKVAEINESEESKNLNRLDYKSIVGALGTAGAGAGIGALAARRYNRLDGAAIGAMAGLSASTLALLAGTIHGSNTKQSLKDAVRNSNMGYIPLVGEYQSAKANQIAERRMKSKLLS